jgi:hypothetical protein
VSAYEEEDTCVSASRHMRRRIHWSPTGRISEEDTCVSASRHMRRRIHVCQHHVI